MLIWVSTCDSEEDIFKYLSDAKQIVRGDERSFKKQMLFKDGSKNRKFMQEMKFELGLNR